MEHTKQCSFCNVDFNVKEHDFGLVLNDQHFLCKECCQTKQNTEIMHWAKSNSEENILLQPIHIWLMNRH